MAYGKKIDDLRRKYKAYLWDAEFRDTEDAIVHADGSCRYSVFNTKKGKRAVVIVNMESNKEIEANLGLENAGKLVIASPELPGAHPISGKIQIPARSAVVVMEQ